MDVSTSLSLQIATSAFLLNAGTVLGGLFLLLMCDVWKSTRHMSGWVTNTLAVVMTMCLAPFMALIAYGMLTLIIATWCPGFTNS